MSDIIYLSNVRLSFPNLIEPQRSVNKETGKERVSYNCELIMPKEHPGFAQFLGKYGELALAKWADKANTIMAMIQNDRKVRCFGRGEEKVNKTSLEPYSGYAGNVFITAGRDTPPQIVQANGKPIDPADTMAYQQLTRAMYAGCKVNAAVKPWLQDNTYGRGVRCDLVAIQFAGDDTPFGEPSLDVSNLFGATMPQTAAPTPSAMPVDMPFPTQLPAFLA